MNKIDLIAGFWKVIAYEQDGVAWPREKCQQRAWLILTSDKVISGSAGIWGEIKYFNQPTADICGKSLRSLRQLILGEDYERSQDYYLYSGGVLYLDANKDGTDSIDLMVYHGSYMYSIEPAHSICQGLYRFDGNQLTVCLADANTKTRPTHFNSIETPYQSLSVYIREDYSGQVLRQSVASNIFEYSETQGKQTVA